MCSENRLKEIRASGVNILKQTSKELEETIRKGEDMSEENDKLFRSLLL